MDLGSEVIEINQDLENIVDRQCTESTHFTFHIEFYLVVGTPTQSPSSIYVYKHYMYWAFSF